MAETHPLRTFLVDATGRPERVGPLLASAEKTLQSIREAVSAIKEAATEIKVAATAVRHFYELQRQQLSDAAQRGTAS